MHFLRILPRKSITTSIRHEYIQEYIAKSTDMSDNNLLYSSTVCIQSKLQSTTIKRLFEYNKR